MKIDGNAASQCFIVLLFKSMKTSISSEESVPTTISLKTHDFFLFTLAPHIKTRRYLFHHKSNLISKCRHLLHLPHIVPDPLFSNHCDKISIYSACKTYNSCNQSMQLPYCLTVITKQPPKLKHFMLK